MSDSLRPHRLQHTRPPCPSAAPRVYSNSFPLSQWCHPYISPSVVPFSSCLQSFLAPGSFPMSQFFASGGRRIGSFSYLLLDNKCPQNLVTLNNRHFITLSWFWGDGVQLGSLVQVFRDGGGARVRGYLLPVHLGLILAVGWDLISGRQPSTNMWPLCAAWASPQRGICESQVSPREKLLAFPPPGLRSHAESLPLHLIPGSSHRGFKGGTQRPPLSGKCIKEFEEIALKPIPLGMKSK